MYLLLHVESNASYVLCSLNFVRWSDSALMLSTSPLEDCRSFVVTRLNRRSPRFVLEDFATFFVSATQMIKQIPDYSDFIGSTPYFIKIDILSTATTNLI